MTVSDAVKGDLKKEYTFIKTWLLEESLHLIVIVIQLSLNEILS
jgi:hypothetical protein